MPEATAEYNEDTNEISITMSDGANYIIGPEAAEDLMIDLDNAVAEYYYGAEVNG